MKPRLIAFTGAAGSGKSTCAKILVREHGFVLVKFAGPLKAMVRGMLGTFKGMSAEEIERFIEGNRKEQPTAFLGGHSPRHIMQTLGTEWGREILGQNFWCDIARVEIKFHLDAGRSVVVDDCRFDNESQTISALGGQTFLVTSRMSGSLQIPHPSENGIAPATVQGIIKNNGNEFDLVHHLRGMSPRP